MTIETLDVFRGRVESMTNPRARRGFLESFYSEFKNEGIFTEDVEGIEKAASLLNKYGFSTHAKKLIAHPAYSQADFIDKNYGELPPQSRKNVLKPWLNTVLINGGILKTLWKLPNTNYLKIYLWLISQYFMKV